MRPAAFSSSYCQHPRVWAQIIVNRKKGSLRRRAIKSQMTIMCDSTWGWMGEPDSSSLSQPDGPSANPHGSPESHSNLWATCEWLLREGRVKVTLTLMGREARTLTTAACPCWRWSPSCPDREGHEISVTHNGCVQRRRRKTINIFNQPVSRLEVNNSTTQRSKSEELEPLVMSQRAMITPATDRQRGWDHSYSDLFVLSLFMSWRTVFTNLGVAPKISEGVRHLAV